MVDVTLEQAFAMAVDHHRAGRLAEAVGIYRMILEREPRVAQAHANLAIALAQMGDWRGARTPAEKATELAPGDAGFWCNLGNILRDVGELAGAEAALQRAIGIDGNLAAAWGNLGQVMYRQRKLRESATAFRRAIAIEPRQLESHNGLGVVLRELREPADAMKCIERAIELSPDGAMAHNNRGMLLTDLGKNEEAEAEFRKAAELEPVNAGFHSNLVYQMNFSERSEREIFQEHLRWGQRHETPLMREAWNYPKAPGMDAKKKLRIGYVSADFREHAVMYFLEPILANHDRDAFEVHCFADEVASDETTFRLRGYADRWHSITALNDREAAELIHAHGIDVLIDLAGHTAHNRLLAFARKPAPVQVTYLGYPNTTGMKGMDFRITDGQSDPLGMTDEFYTEKLWRLPRTFLCYRLPGDAASLDVGERKRSARPTTFGYFGTGQKLSGTILRLWGEILRGAAGARLLLKMRGDVARRALVEKLSRCGVDVERVDFVNQTDSRAEHFAQHGLMDIALDSYPYNGTTTTCEALAMGVPVVSLAGRTHASRVGKSLLSSVALGELAAATPEEYVQKAVELAGDLDKVQEMKRSLPQRMRRSPLMDEAGFTREIEEAYRGMWRMVAT